MSDKRYLVCDLDGTLCKQMYDGNYHLAAPIMNVIETLNSFYDEGWDVTIFTARGMRTCKGDIKEIEERYRTMTEKWLSDNGVKYTKLFFGKPPGDIYVDDRGYTPAEFVISRL